LLSITAPAPAPGQPVQTTQFRYDVMGQVTNVVYPDGASVTNVYSLAGDLLLSKGARTYPAGFGYDSQGRMTSMTNWTNFAGGAGARVTTWTNHAQRGWLQGKRDAQSRGADYEYYASGRLAKRTWARGTTAIYTNTTAGDLLGITYNDATPSVAFTYDERGRLTNVTQGAASTSYTWNDAGQLVREAYSGGPLSGLAVTNAYDSLDRRTAVALLSQPSTLVHFGYDAASPLQTVSNGVVSVQYTYLANSPWVQDIRFRHAGSARMAMNRSYDNLNRLTGVSSFTSAGKLFSYAYGYNPAGQRTNATLPDNSNWQYGYDALGQASSGKRRWSGGTNVAGQQFEYTFDDIGNRTQTKTGGDQTGAGLRTSTYSVNTSTNTHSAPCRRPATRWVPPPRLR